MKLNRSADKKKNKKKQKQKPKTETKNSKGLENIFSVE